jgi:hypothetical protein
MTDLSPGTAARIAQPALPGRQPPVLAAVHVDNQGLTSAFIIPGIHADHTN